MFYCPAAGAGSPYVLLPGSRGIPPYSLLPGGVGRVRDENASILPAAPARRYSPDSEFPPLASNGWGRATVLCFSRTLPAVLTAVALGQWTLAVGDEPLGIGPTKAALVPSLARHRRGQGPCGLERASPDDDRPTKAGERLVREGRAGEGACREPREVASPAKRTIGPITCRHPRASGSPPQATCQSFARALPSRRIWKRG